MVLSSVFVLTAHGAVLVEKHWRGLLPRSLVDSFWTEVQQAESPADVCPVLALGSAQRYYCYHVQRGGLFFVGICQTEQPPLVVLELLDRLAETLKGYFDDDLSEKALRENFVTVYQVLEEMCDHGFPFTTEPNALHEIIPPPSLRTQLGQVVGKSALQEKVGQGALSNTPWRRFGVKHAANEIFVDVIEVVDATVEADGRPVYCETQGEVRVLSKLSGMPDLTLTMLNTEVVDDVSFHPCVRLARWEQSRSISFVPPDGHFKLMDYRVKGPLELPMYVKPQIMYSEGAGKVTIMVGQRPGTRPVDNVVITIPFPKSMQSPQLSPNCGSIAYNDKAKEMKWTIGTIPTDRTPQLDGTVTLKSDMPVPESNPVINVNFTVPGAVPSNIRVDKLELHNEMYKPFKGVRLITKGGRFFVRG